MSETNRLGHIGIEAYKQISNGDTVTGNHSEVAAGLAIIVKILASKFGEQNGLFEDEVITHLDRHLDLY